jgi:hypothetical protein
MYTVRAYNGFTTEVIGSFDNQYEAMVCLEEHFKDFSFQDWDVFMNNSSITVEAP